MRSSRLLADVCLAGRAGFTGRDSLTGRTGLAARVDLAGSASLAGEVDLARGVDLAGGVDLVGSNTEEEPSASKHLSPVGSIFNYSMVHLVDFESN